MEKSEISVSLSQDVECDKHQPFCHGAIIFLSKPTRRVAVCLECLQEELEADERSMDELAAQADRRDLEAKDMGAGI